MAYKRLGDLLIAAGTINEEQLSKALSLQKGSGLRLGEVLIKNNIITENELIEALKLQLGIEFVDLTNISIPVELANFVPKNVAKRFNLVPVKLYKDVLYIAMSDPLDFNAQEEVKKTSHKSIIPMIGTNKSINNAINSLYGNEGTARAMEEMKKEAYYSSDIVPVQMENNIEDTASAPTIRFVNSIIEKAINERASDIHLEPQADEMLIRMRIDGTLRKIFTVPNELQDTVISRLKVMGGMNISEHNIPQDGHYMLAYKGHNIDIRISSIPTTHGEKMVLRILDKSTGIANTKALGLNEQDLAKYKELLKNSNGVILIVGPTGSGKSTTMASMLQELANDEVNITTLEDPVEYDLKGINQCQINEKTGLTFASGLRSILRQDPDVIAVGEIRDEKTASIAMRAAIAGRLVLSTVHTNNSIGTIQRLKDIGVEPYLIGSGLRGVISQRLVKKICPHCKKPYKASLEEKKELGLDVNKDYVFYQASGCPECFHQGTYGRKGVFEILMINQEIKKLIDENANEDELTKAILKTDFVPLKDSLRSMVLKGEIMAKEAIKTAHSTIE